MSEESYWLPSCSEIPLEELGKAIGKLFVTPIHGAAKFVKDERTGLFVSTGHTFVPGEQVVMLLGHHRRNFGYVSPNYYKVLYKDEVGWISVTLRPAEEKDKR